MHDQFVYSMPHEHMKFVPSEQPKLKDAILYLKKFTADDYLDIRKLSYNPETDETTVHLVHADKIITFTPDTPLTPELIGSYELGISAAETDIRWVIEKLDELTATGTNHANAVALGVLLYASVPHLEPEAAEFVITHCKLHGPAYLECHWKPLSVSANGAGGKPQFAFN